MPTVFRNYLIIRYSLLFAFLLLGAKLFPGNPFILSSEILQAWPEVNRFRTSTARVLLRKDAGIHPGNPFQYLLSDQAAFIEIIVSEDPQRYRLELAERQNRLNALSAGDEQSPYYLFALAEFHLHWAILRMKFEEPVQGALELRKASILINRNLKQFPQFGLNLKTWGLIQTIAGAVPPNFQWLAEKSGIKGRAEDGITSLQKLEKWIQVNGQFHFLLPEILFYQLFIIRNLPGEYPVQAIENRAQALIPTEPLIRFVLAALAQKNNQPSKVISILETPQETESELRFCYLDYMLGEALLNQSLPGSEKRFQAFISCTKGEQYIKSAYRKWAWSALINGNTGEYLRLMNLAKIKGSDKYEDDRQVMIEANRKDVPPLEFIKARVCFDGGKYRESLAELLKLYPLKPMTGEVRAELHYRLGRAYEKLGDRELASIFYRATISEAEKMPDYLYAASAYYLALIYQQDSNSNEAIRLFQLVIKSPDHPYKKSLDAKAKVAIQHIRP